MAPATRPERTAPRRGHSPQREAAWAPRSAMAGAPARHASDRTSHSSRRRPARPRRARRRTRSPHRRATPTTSRALAGARAAAWSATARGRCSGRGLYSRRSASSSGRRMSDATNGFRIFRTEPARDPRIGLEQRVARQLRARAIRALQGDPAGLQGGRAPRDRPVPGDGRVHEHARRARLVAAVPAGRSCSAPGSGDDPVDRPRAFGGRRVLVTGGAGSSAGRSRGASWTPARS